MKKQSATFKSGALPRFLRATFIAGLLPALVFLLGIQISHAGSATWNLNPANGNWNTAGDWTPATVPNGASDIASFDVSNTTSISVSANVVVNEIVFSSTASAYTITTPASSHSLTISGTGITNNSGQPQNLTVPPASTLIFKNTATVGPLTTVNNQSAASGGPVGLTNFLDASNAGTGTFVTNGTTSTSGSSSQITFLGTASAANASFINNGANPAGSAGLTLFFETSTAASATFTNIGFPGFGETGNTRFYDNSTADHATLTNVAGGYIMFFGSSTAADSIVTSNGGTISLHAGNIEFLEQSTAGNATFVNGGGDGNSVIGAFFTLAGQSDGGNATVVANGGVNGGLGALIEFYEEATGGKASFNILGNAKLTMNNLTTSGTTLGSLEGAGTVFLSSKELTIGNNGRSTTFDGIIQDSGSLIKIKKGKFVLTNANTYTGGTTIKGGSLFANNSDGSATGTGFVQVNAGTLAGRGSIAGPVTIGTGSGGGAFLAPAGPAIGVLRMQASLTFKAQATYLVELNSGSARADKVIANGVTIDSAALISITDLDNAVLVSGTVLRVINNISAAPITGTFVNLPDGSTVSIGNNTFQANYEGGDGNDLTLTVVP
jgi:autotransporter-associated beta strand protein